jgi:hypothetical protein
VAAGLRTDWPATSRRRQAALAHSLVRGGDRREALARRAVDQDPFEAWAGSPVGGALQEAHTGAAPPLRQIIRMRGLGGAGSHIRSLCSALGEARHPAREGSPAR